MKRILTKIINGTLAITIAFSSLLSPLIIATKAAAAPLTQATFTRTIIDASQAPWGKNLADINGDGQLDAIEGGGDNLGTNVYWYEYPTWTKYQIGTAAGDDDLQVADINNDGAMDVIVNGGLSWYANPRGAGGDVHGLWVRHTVDATSNSHDLQIGDLNADGKLDMAVRGTGEVGPTTLYLQGATADIWIKVAMPNAPDGQATAIADIDRDGRNDLIGNGYWLQQPSTPATGASWIRHDFVGWTPGASVNAADINRDGRIDIFLAPSEAGTGTLSWFQNPADSVNGTWERHDILTDVTDIHRFHLVDMNKDGNLDLVFAEMHQSPLKRVGIFYNGGNGASWTLQTLSTAGSHNIAVGDVGNDGDIDILGANWATSASDGGALNLWRNDLAGGLSFANWIYAAIDTAKADPTFGLNFGDMNRDGLKDIIAGHYMYKNPGNGMTTGWTRVDLGSDKDAMLTTDVDGDGQLDIIAQAQVAGAINVYWLKPSDTTASAFTSTLVGTLPSGSRDYTSQGYDTAQFIPGARPQILFSNDFGDYYFTVPSNPGAGSWPRTQVNSDGTQEGVVAGDINSDGRPDVIGSSHTTSNADGKEVDWWTNPGTGAGSWVKHAIGTTTNEVSRVRIADINKDGRADVVAADDDLNNSRGNVYWFEQMANGTWTQHTIATNLGSLESMDIGDFNSDGSVDVVTGDHRSNGLQTIIWENAGGGNSWVNHVVDTGKESHLGTRVHDLDNDGDLDIVSIAYDAYQTVHLWRNDATASTITPDTNAPVISTVASSGIAPSAATISWTTDEPSDSQVEYGTTTSYGSVNTLNTSLSSTHSMTLTGLSPSTAYHYRVLSKDAAGNQATSGDFTFTTLAAGAIAHIQTAANTANTGATTISQGFSTVNTAGDAIIAAISWGSNSTVSCSDSQGNSYAVATTQYDSTNQQSLGVCYALNSKAGTNTVTATFSGSSSYRRMAIHEYSGIASANAIDKTVANNAVATTAANSVTSNSATTTVAGDLIFGAVMDDAGTTNITAGTGFTQRSSLNNKDFATQDMVQVASGPVASTQTFGAAHRYLAQMVAFKAAGGTVTPDTTPPVISSVAGSGTTTSGTTITWTTDEASDSQVQYGTTMAYGTTTTLNTSLVAAHTVALSGLSAGTTYHYRVISKDAAGNQALSSDFTFVTPTATTIGMAQTASNSSNATAKTIAQAFTSPNTAGNLIAVAVSWGNNATITCSDTQGNTYAIATTQYDSTNHQSLGVCYAANVKGGANTVTVTFSTSADYRRLLVHEYYGLATTNPVDVVAKNVATSTTAINSATSTAATTTVAGDLIFGAVMDDAGTTNITAGTGFTQRNLLSGDLATQDLTKTTAGSIASTHTFSTAHRYLAQMVAFKPAP